MLEYPLTPFAAEWYSGHTFSRADPAFGQLELRSFRSMPTRNSPKNRRAKTSEARNLDLQGASLPTRRQFLRTAAGAGLALAGSSLTAWADHHGHPTPNSISYLDRRMYIHNMELLAHFAPGQHRGG